MASTKRITLLLLLTSYCLAQSPDYGQQSKVSCNAAPLSFVTMKQVTSGVETDMVLAISKTDGLGESTLVASSTFVGGRYEHSFPSISKWIDNNSALSGYNLKFGITLTPGLVKTSTVLHWGE